jgi:hypothetical protein
VFYVAVREVPLIPIVCERCVIGGSYCKDVPSTYHPPKSCAALPSRRAKPKRAVPHTEGAEQNNRKLEKTEPN